MAVRKKTKVLDSNKKKVETGMWLGKTCSGVWKKRSRKFCLQGHATAKLCGGVKSIIDAAGSKLFHLVVQTVAARIFS